MQVFQGEERIYRNYQAFLVDKLATIITESDLVDTRNGPAWTMYSQNYNIMYPTERFTLLPSRKNNPVATIAETLWVLAGRNDIDFLAPYLKRASLYSDDGIVWRAGYGPRLRRWHGKIDQLALVIDALKKDKGTRRAAICLWDPELDWQSSLDIPCNDFMSFRCSEGRLSMSVFQRSNDIMWGSMINVFEWSVLQELVASSIGAMVGFASYNTANLHLYDIHKKKAVEIISDAMTSQHGSIYSDYTHPVYESSGGIVTGLENFDADLFSVMAMEAKSRHPGYDLFDDRMLEDIANPFLEDAIVAMSAYNQMQFDPEGFELRSYLGAIEGVDMRIAVTEYLQELQEQLVQKNKKHNRRTPQSVIAELIKLQEIKGAVYGDSWKKHGEVLSIFANISRKVDRILSIHEGGMRDVDLNDETVQDTMADLAVYCGLYASWISGESFKDEMRSLDGTALDRSLTSNDEPSKTKDLIIEVIKTAYDAVEAHLVGGGMMESDRKHILVRMMAIQAIAWLCLGQSA